HLAQMAKERGISGWHAMRKDQLIRALTVTRAPGSRAKKDATPVTAQPAARKPSLPKKQSVNAAELAVAARRPAPAARIPRALRLVPADPRRGPCAARSRPRVPEGQDHRLGPRPVLAARLLGVEPEDPGAGPGRAGTGMAQRPAHPPPDGRHQRGHHHRLRTA